MKQATFASLAWSSKGKVSKRERFPAEMDAVTPWAKIPGLIAPHYPTDGLGRARKDLLPELLHGGERELYGDRACWSEEPRWLCRQVGIRYRVNRRGKRVHELSPAQRRINRSRSRVRARVEHPFNVVKRLWGFTKVRYRGLAKNLAKAYAMFALANLYLVRRQLMPPGARCVL